MPIVIEEDGGKWKGTAIDAGCTWDVNSATTLFWAGVPIRMKLGGQDDRTRQLSVRILLWDNSIRRQPKTLGITITSDENHFFLYTLEVSEEDFAALRQDQGILVDFASFPDEVISLLKCCIASATEGNAKFQAVLETSGGAAKFNIVETNKFKHLTHISLMFQLGTDTSIKQYLSSRLQEVTREAGGLEADKAELQTRIANLEASVAELNEFQVHGRQSHERTLNELSAGYEKQLVDERSKRVSDLSEANERFGRESAEAAQKHSAERDALQRRVTELEEETHSLREAKYALDSKVSQLSAQHGSASGELVAVRQECDRLKEANLALGIEKHGLERSLNEAHVELASLKTQVADKDSLNVSNTGRLAELEKSKAMLEQSLEESREQHKAAEARFREQKAEAQKGIQLIERFQNEIAAGKSKNKAYRTMLQNLETQKRTAEEERDRLQATIDAVKQEAEARKLEVEVAQRTIDDQKAKLAEAHQQIDSNRKFISYLNSQCNQAQIGAATTSRYPPLQTSNRYNLVVSSPSSQPHLGPGGRAAATSTAEPSLPYKPYSSYTAGHMRSNGE